jgi:hypothetical protein
VLGRRSGRRRQHLRNLSAREWRLRRGGPAPGWFDGLGLGWRTKRTRAVRPFAGSKERATEGLRARQLVGRGHRALLWHGQRRVDLAHGALRSSRREARELLAHDEALEALTNSLCEGSDLGGRSAIEILCRIRV